MCVYVSDLAGAKALLIQAQALAKLCSDDAFRALDTKNAFGKVARTAIMEEVLAELPELGLFIAWLWGEAGTPIHVAAEA